mmetsp:Transcript_72648/g.166679  ORF Transcript_72648/g.166679 Transcript_72648/m.166679 type:complete len:356 (-) Transcript_72648:1976-3043(-)
MTSGLTSLGQDLTKHLRVHRTPGEREVRSPSGRVRGHDHGLDVLNGLLLVRASVDQGHLELQVHRSVVGVLQNAHTADIIQRRCAPGEVASVAGVTRLIAPHRLTPPLRSQIPIHQLVHVHSQMHPVCIHLARLTRAPRVGVAGRQPHKRRGAQHKLGVHTARRVGAHADLAHAPSVGGGGSGEDLEAEGDLVPWLRVGRVQGPVRAGHHPAPGGADAGVGGGDPRRGARAHRPGSAVGVCADGLRVARAGCAVVDVFNQQEISVDSVYGHGPPAVAGPDNAISRTIQSHRIHPSRIGPDRVPQHPHPRRSSRPSHEHLEHELPRRGSHELTSGSPGTEALDTHHIRQRRAVPGG